jgi:hypothetical protein
MLNLPFKNYLIQSVVTNVKPGTVRQVRKVRPIKAGDVVCCVTGMRSKKFKRHTVKNIEKVYPIKIDCIQKKIWIDGVEMVPIIRRYFATKDINGTEQQFFDFFKKQKYTRPLVWICWDAKEVDMWDEWLKSNQNIGRFVQLPTIN